MLRSLLAAVALATPLQAQDVQPCDWHASAWTLVEPWEQFSRTYARGAVRIALLDTIEPAAAAFFILVLSPPYDEVGGRQCRTIGLAPGAGFAGADFDVLQANYDPAAGLVFGLPMQRFDAQGGDFERVYLRFTLNQSTGEIRATLR